MPLRVTMLDVARQAGYPQHPEIDRSLHWIVCLRNNNWGAHVDESYWSQVDCSSRTCFASAADGTHRWLRAILPRRKQAVWRRMHSEQLAVLQPYRLSYQRQEQGRPVRCRSDLLFQSTKPKFHGWAFLLRARQPMRRQRRKTERAMCPLSEDRWSRAGVYDLLPLKKCARRTSSNFS